MMSSMSRVLLLAATIIVPGAARAQDTLAPLPTLRSAVVSSNAGIADTLATWNSLHQSNALPFTSYADFLIRHPGFPAELQLRKLAETRLTADSTLPMQVVRFFTVYPPQTASAALRFAEAQDAMGQRDAARLTAKRAWAMGPLTIEDEARLAARFGSALTQADHDARTDRLLWSRATTGAARALPLASPARQPLFDARLAMQAKSPEATNKGALTSGAGRGDAGWIVEREAWLRETGQDVEARALLATPQRLAVAPLDAGRWLDMLWRNARSAADAGQTPLAFEIARQLDDAYPVGTDIRRRPLVERDVYTSLAWLAGTLAMNRLGRPGEAVALFDRYNRAAQTPQTQVKGLYWAGRAAESAGRTTDAQAYYARAAEFFDQFYGQLAAERTGRPLTVPPVKRTLEVSTAQREAFFGSEIVRTAIYLGQTGDWATQSLFVRAIAAAAESDVEHVLGAELALRVNRPDLGVMIGRSAGSAGLRDYVRTGFPTIPVSADVQPSWTMIHAIARQESQFDRKIQSKAGARGLMQLMPGTAREVAGKIGLSFEGANLDDPAYNASLGAWYFSALMTRFNGSYVLAVAAYNAGAGNVNKWIAANGDPRTPSADVLAWIEAIPFRETRDYVQRVLENAVVYEMINPRPGPARRYPLSSFLGKALPG